MIGQPQWQPCFFQLLGLQQPFKRTHYCSNGLISDIAFRTLIMTFIEKIVMYGEFSIQVENRDIIFQLEAVWTDVVWLGWRLYHQMRRNDILFRGVSYECES